MPVRVKKARKTKEYNPAPLQSERGYNAALRAAR
jgi:hypothetical protein